MEDTMAKNEQSSGGKKTIEEKRQKVHLVVAGASQFGQYACARVLHRAYAHVTKVTMIVARKDEHAFHNWKPAVAEWSHFSNLYECITELREEKRPIDYVFDDNIQYLVAELLKENGDYERIGYIATRSEEHLPYTTILASCCDRVLIEKPVSKCVEDVQKNGYFTKLGEGITRWNKRFLADKVTTCEHFTFRKGFSDAMESLNTFIEDHWDHKSLMYVFQFFEPAEVKSLVSRLSAMQDGSILDVGITHGLGPLSYILRKRGDNIDLHDSITWDRILVKQARERADSNASLAVPVLAETAAYLEGTCEVDKIHKIELEIRSGKGGPSHERRFRFICQKCKKIKDEYFVGVSLGSAGYTEFKKGENGVSSVINEDSGWLSDRFGGTSTVAENAQAAMLEEFINDRHSDRFIPLDQACQIVQLAIEAQALGFCQDRKPYKLDQKVDNWSKESETQSDHHINLKKVWEMKPERVLDRLKMALGIEDILKHPDKPYKPCFRVVTIFGPEGVGNTDISERLQKKLNDDLKKNIVHLIKVPRDKNWCKGKGSSDFSVERVMRDLGEKLKIVTDVSTDTAADLCERVQKCKKILKKNPCILIINGIDRLGENAYASLIRVLNELPPEIRIIMVTNKGEQTCGWVVRSEELIKDLLVKDVTKRHRENLINFLENISGYKLETRQIIENIKKFANDNITLYRQLCSYLRYIALPRFYCKQKKLSIKALKTIIKRELASISLPRTITPFPEEMLERISILCIGAIYSQEDLRMIISLCEVPDRIPGEFLDSLYPGLSKRMEIKDALITSENNALLSLLEHTPQWYDDASDKGTFAIFPHIRQVACKYDASWIQEVCADVDRRRMSLSVPFSSEESEIPPINLSLELLFNLIKERAHGSDSLKVESGDLFKLWYKELAASLEHGHEGWSGNQFDKFLSTLLNQKRNLALETFYGFGRLDLESGSLFGERCKELADALERDHVGRPDSRLYMFLSEILNQKTNLGIETRAFMIALEAWIHLRSATDWETIIPLRDRMTDAINIYQKFMPFNQAFGDPFLRLPRKEALASEGPPAEVVRYLVSTSMELEKVWYWLYSPYIKPIKTRLSESLKKRGEELEHYVEKSKKTSGRKEKERLAVLLRVLSLLDAYKNKDKRDESDKPFESEINKLGKAYTLLKDALKITGEATITAIDEGIFMRLGLNQSVCALLYFHRALIKEENNENENEKEDALKLAAEALGNLNLEFKTHNFNFEECPFALLTLARLLYYDEGFFHGCVEEIIPESGEDEQREDKSPGKLTDKAIERFRLTGRDYFAELAKNVKEEFSKDKVTNQKEDS